MLRKSHLSLPPALAALLHAPPLGFPTIHLLELFVPADFLIWSCCLERISPP